MDEMKTSRRSGFGLWPGWNRPGVCGLDNSGNSCYLNAVLQCLSSTVPLVEHLMNPDVRTELTKYFKLVLYPLQASSHVLLLIRLSVSLQV